MEATLTLVTVPASEPLTLAEAKTWLRIDESADDSRVAAMIAAAREVIEEHTGRQLITATWRLTLDEFPEWAIDLPRGPVQSITAVQYVDTAGDTQTLSSASYRFVAAQNLIEPAYGLSWPITRSQAGAVTIDYVSGTSTAPERAKQAMRFLLAHWDMDPASVGKLPEGAESLLHSLWCGRYT